VAKRARSTTTQQASLFGEEPAANSEQANAECGVRNSELPEAASNTAAGPSTNALSRARTVADAPHSAFRTPHSALPFTGLAGRTVWVVDANSLIFQVFHAIPEMTSPKGEPVNAVFGFTRDLLYLLEVKRPDFLFCAFDRPEPTFRHVRFPEYKAHRSECPPELIPQFPLIRRMIEAMGIPIFEHPDFEADDVLATIAHTVDEQGGECYVVTADKDARQLLTDRVKIYNLRKNQPYDAASLAADWGVRPDQVVDFQALVGDSVDGVPGVPQIGPKAAKELLDKYDTLDGIYAHVDEITAVARKRTLVENKDNAYLSQELVRLERRMPLEIDWPRLFGNHLNGPACIALCNELGFHRITQQFRALGGAAPTADTPVADDWQADYRTVDTVEGLRELVEKMRSVKRLSIDTETTSTSPTAAELVGYSFAWEPGVGYYVPVKGPTCDTCLDPTVAADLLRPILEDPTIAKVGQNLKYDQIVLRGAGIELRGITFDTLLAAYLLDAGERNHNLDELAQRHLNHTNIKIESLIGTGKNQRRMDEAPVADVAKYAAEDADVALRLVDLLEPKLRATGDLEKLFHDVEVPLIDVLADLESTGIRIDSARLNELSARYAEQMKRIEAEIYALAGREFNIASPKQLATVLFEELKLPVLAKTKTGPSTDAEVLGELAALHALPAKIVEFRQYAKLKGTYVDALPQLVNPRTGRVHCSLHQAVAATGRLSSSDPNLQNIPIRTETGREIRSAFLPGQDDWLLLSADYSQIELRVLAHYSQDERMLAAFAAGEDIHASVAAQVAGVPLDQVTREQRRAAKAVNFGIIYGQSAFGLAKSLGIPQAEAAEFIDHYFAQFPGVERFMNQVLVDCDRDGYVTTILGRRRAVKGVRVNAGRQRNLAERTAINSVIQGSAADLIKLAMLRVHERVKAELPAAHMLLQIHDELLFETPTKHREALAKLVRQAMTGVLELRVPLVVDVKIGKNWAETEATE
jgi:DNA polymerase-1